MQEYAGEERRGLWHPSVGRSKVSDLKVVAAFEIDARKTGLDLSKAIFASPNVARRYVALRPSRVRVGAGLLKGDTAPHLRNVPLERSSISAVAEALRSSGAEILVNLISSGSDGSSEEYAEAALAARCAFVNCTPSPVTRNAKLAAAFAKAKLPLVGDDLMSQFGGTAFHKGLLGLMVKRGVKIEKSYQLDVGGGSETLNTIDEAIKLAKRTVKTESVASEVPYKFETIAGTTDFVDYMGNDRTSYFWAQGNGFLGSGVSVDIYLRTSDGANAGNVILDVVRATSRAMRSGKLGGVNEICAYGFKSAPRPLEFEEAYSKFSAIYVP